MLISMTGFGRGEATENGIKATVEMKSLNSRYLDISVRLPQRLQHKELAAKDLIKQSISRGKVNVTVHITQQETGEPHLSVDREKVTGYMKLLKQLKETAGIEDEVTLRTLINFGDVFVSNEDDEETLEEAWQVTQKALSEATDTLVEMRTQEGSQLKNDLASRIHAIEEQLDMIAELSKRRMPEAKKKLTERIRQMVDDDNLDPDRLEMEIAILVDKMDVTEEIVRLRSHLKFFLEALGQGNSVGRRLNFLSQEINRELNTIGSKASNSEMAQYVVKGKENLEQIREQVQNVE